MTTSYPPVLNSTRELTEPGSLLAVTPTQDSGWLGYENEFNVSCVYECLYSDRHIGSVFLRLSPLLNKRLSIQRYDKRIPKIMSLSCEERCFCNTSCMFVLSIRLIFVRSQGERGEDAIRDCRWTSRLPNSSCRTSGIRTL